jgi:hypothetical protein
MSNDFVRTSRSARSASAAGLLLSIASVGVSQTVHVHDEHVTLVRPDVMRYVIPGKPQISTLHSDGSQVIVDSETVWRFMCGSDTSGLSVGDLEGIALQHGAEMQAPGVRIVDSGLRDGGLDLIFVLSGNVPSQAVPAIAEAEAYLEGLFADPITVQINVSWGNLGDNVIGATSSSYASATWGISRAGLLDGRDSNDIIQAYLPASSTLPVRYNGGSDTVTDETRVYWTRANYRATIGTVAGDAADMTFNTQFSFDYDPSNGVSGTSFIDVMVHEVGHALGFTSGADFRVNDMEALDIFRFQRTDGSFNYNPETIDDFKTTPRLVDFNTPNEQHISDIIYEEYRMSDGNPWQASHFRETFPSIGQMDPALGSGSTRYPDYFDTSDITMFDAIGYDYPGGDGCPPPIIDQQPAALQEVCPDDVVSLSVSLAIGETANFQWRKGDVPIVDDGERIFGATSNTLLIVGVTNDDIADNYNCYLTNDCGGEIATTNASIQFGQQPLITGQPSDQTVDPGGVASFSVTAAGVSLSYQWRKDGVDLVDDGERIFGATSNGLLILDVEPGDAGDYDCVISDTFAVCDAISDIATLTVNGATPCEGDLNGDGERNLSDLGVLLASFETDGGGDIDGDGDTDLADLGALLAVFDVPCP